MLRDPLTEKISQSVVESELGSAVETHSSEKGSSVPDELNRTDALPIRGDLSEASKAEAWPLISDHVLIRRIGRGAYGEVWLGRNAIGSLRAIKVVTRKTFSDDRPFQREFEGICKFEPISRTHPGFVTILQVGEHFEEGYFYYVMELADDAQTGQRIEVDTYVPRTLAQELKTHPRLPLETSLPIGLSLTSALAHLHAHKFIHRDIKPSNIIFVKGLPKFADIGLITEAGKDVSSVGSLNYMPPERPGESTGDVFSLGKVFYGLFMGMPCERFPELPGAAEEFTTNPALQQLNNLILKACHYDPEQRFQTANELREALVSVTETVQRKRPGTGAGGPGHSDPGTKTPLPEGRDPEGRPAGGSEPRPKARWTRRAALILLPSGIAGVAFHFWNRRKPDPVIRAVDPVVVLMDTTAKDGRYLPDDINDGGSNAVEVAKVLKDLLPSRSMVQVPISLGWDRKDYVRSLRPHLVIIHRSAFFHTENAVLKYGQSPEFLKPADDPRWVQLYHTEDIVLKSFLALVGAVPHTHFLVYSRGTGPTWKATGIQEWLAPGFQEAWKKNIETDYPDLKGRIHTMTITREKKGSFRNPETSAELRNRVRKILGLPGKPE